MPEEKQPPAKLRHLDLPELRETFADSVRTVVWDGQTLRVELSVTRVSDIAPGEAAQATRYPAARLVLTPQASVDLYNRLQQTMAALVKSGLIKQQPSAAPAGTA
jgi:hypothetical protein